MISDDDPAAPDRERRPDRTGEAGWPDAAVLADLEALRSRAPLTHCITNIVAAPITANILLALGAAPAMVLAPEEAAPFAAIASGLLINVGTILPAEAESMLAAAESAGRQGTPWVLDPVAVGALPLRTRVARDLLRFRPAIIRGNASEILGLAGAGAGGKGVESTDRSDAAIDTARMLAHRSGAVVAVSGEVDYVTDGETVIAVPGGHILMTKVTGIGCALGATMAAFAGVSETPLQAAVSASAIFAAAGTQAAGVAAHPGSFAVAFIDAISALARS